LEVFLRRLRVVRQLERKCVIPAYYAFLKNTLLPFQFTIKEPEQDNTTAPEVYPLKKKLRNKTSERK
jgi:hypothetical protein